MRWLARGEPQLPPGDTWLTPAERDRAATMRFTKRRTEYLVRRFAAKSAVAASLGWDATADLGRIGVPNRATGAPYVEVDGEPYGVDVSLTDRAGWAVCLVGQDAGPVGCDLELVEPRSDGFVADYLTPAEQALVAAGDRDVVANLLWSAKESALKVLRTGLRRDTRSVDVTPADPVPAEWAAISVRVDGGALVLPGWWRRDGGWLLTVVSATPADPPAALEVPVALAQAVPVHSWTERPLAD